MATPAEVLTWRLAVWSVRIAVARTKLALLRLYARVLLLKQLANTFGLILKGGTAHALLSVFYARS